ncbi:MAG: glycosyltransferase family 4 protein [Thermodesulfobacteriota bacterium]|nr:glycosyltransferase family 4 protein [Thermodesulfobacteriota bacterium]
MGEQIRVIVNAPFTSRGGGVSGYFRQVLPHLGPGIVSFTTGRRQGPEGNIGRIARLWLDYVRFCRTVRKKGCDVVHINPSLRGKALVRDAIFIILAKLLQKPVVVFIHGWDSDCEEALRRYWLRLFELVYFRAEAFVVLASEFSRALREMGYRGQIYVESTAVSDGILELEKTHQTLDELTAPGLTRRLLYLARVEQKKGIYEAIDIYRRIKTYRDGICLLVAGDGSELEKCKKYVQSRNVRDVVFLGHVSGDYKEATFQMCDLYLFPTFHGEGMPVSLLEAMAYGLPVITRRVGGIKDFFENGKMGLGVDGTDLRELEDFIVFLHDNPAEAERIGSYNRQFAARYFVAHIVAKRLTRIYEAVVHGKGKRSCHWLHI